MLCYMICTVDGSMYVPNGQHGRETCLKIQNKGLADGQELEDWQEYAYVNILKYQKPWRLPAKVVRVQQSRSQSVTWIPLSEALHNMLLYVEDQKREKIQETSMDLNVLVSKLPPTPRTLHHRIQKNHGTRYVLKRQAIPMPDVTRTVRC